MNTELNHLFAPKIKTKAEILRLLLPYLRLAHEWSQEPERSEQLPRLLKGLIVSVEHAL